MQRNLQRGSAPQNRSVGKSLCVVGLASAAKRKKLDLCPLKPPRAVNTLRAASFSAGFVLWDKMQWHN